MAAVEGREWKEWAREYMRGMENVAVPSFTPDLTRLDEDGIRWDVQTAIRHGFFSTASSGDWSLTFEERKQFHEILCDEAGDDIQVGLMTNNVGSWDQMIELVQHAEKVGVKHALIYYPSWFYPESLEEIYLRTREVCDAANIGIVIWATAADDQYRFHHSSVPFELYDKIVDIPNVMAMKTGFSEPGMVYEVFERYGKKIEVNIGHPTQIGMIPMLRKRYSPQWAGTGGWELWQSPEKPHMVEMFDHFINGRYEQAWKLYWMFVKANTMSFFGGNEHYDIGAVDTGHGFIDWITGKYMMWSVGGNGGPVRQPSKPLTQRTMAARKRMLKALGIEPREPDEEFFVGRVNYQKMQQNKA